MISLSTNCYRVDAVKASYNQLKLQVAQNDAAQDPAVRNANQQLQTVDQQVKANDAEKAELALSSARSAVAQLSYQRSGEVVATQAASSGNVNVFA